MKESPKIYIPDLTYDNVEFYPDLDETASSKKFSKEISDLSGLSVQESNIGSGADWPALVIELLKYLKNNDVFFLSLGAFFAGKAIDENLEAWLNIAKKIKNLISKISSKFSKLSNVILNRSASINIGVEEYIKQNPGDFKNIQLLQYEVFDFRDYDDIKKVVSLKKNCIIDEVLEKNLGDSIHYFRLIINDEEVEIVMYGQSIIIK